MLRRKLLATVKLLRSFGQMIVVVGSNVKTSATSITSKIVSFIPNVLAAPKVNGKSRDAKVVKADIYAASAPKLDSKNYTANVVDVDVCAEAVLQIEAENREVAIANADNPVVVQLGIKASTKGAPPVKYKKGGATIEIENDAEGSGASVGYGRKAVQIESTVDSVSAGGSVGDIKKSVEIDAMADAEGVSVQFLDFGAEAKAAPSAKGLAHNVHHLKFGTTASASHFLSANAAEKVYGLLSSFTKIANWFKPSLKTSSTGAVKPEVTTEIVASPEYYGSATSDEIDNTISTFTTIDPTSSVVVDTNTAKEQSLETSFSPIARLWWAYQVGSKLYMREAYNITQTENNLKIE